MDNKVKQSLGKAKGAWSSMAPTLRRVLVISLLALVAFAIALTMYLNMNAGRWVLLYNNLEREESSEIYAILQDMEIPSQLDATGAVMVQASQKDYIVGQMAMKSYPRSTLTYDIFSQAQGLTTTDFEKQQLSIFQLQNRLQDTINLYSGVRSSVVTLSVAQDSTRVWEASSNKSTGSVTVQMRPGEQLTPEEVSGIKYLVSASVPNMAQQDVEVFDAETQKHLLSSDEVDSRADIDYERLNFEDRVERRLVEKALNVLTLAYDPSDVRVSATVVIDYAKMATESKQYQPSEASTINSGVLQHQDTEQTTVTEDNAQGLPGEEDNTDVPTMVDGLVDNTQTTRSSSSSDFAVSYIMQQIEKDRAELKNASISVALNGEIDDIVRQSIIDNVSKATNIPPENVSVQSYIVQVPTDRGGTGLQLTPTMMLAIGGGFLLLLLLLIILIVLLARKKKKKKNEQEQALAEAQEQLEQIEPLEEVIDAEDAEFNLQQELEERKRQLRENAQSNTADEAITNEVREFARNNPEITANLLRAWMKEEVD